MWSDMLLRSPWILFAGFIVEGMSVPAPMEALFLLSGYHIQEGRLSFWQAAAMASVGNAIGGTIIYLVARGGGRPLLDRYGPYLGVTETRLAAVQRWFHTYGGGAVLLTRWTGFGYGPTLWGAGISRLPLWGFLGFLLAGNTVWALVWTYIGYRFSFLVSRLAELETVAGWLLAGIGGLALLFMVFKAWRLRRVKGRGPSLP